jgi:hypothetical protein
VTAPQTDRPRPRRDQPSSFGDVVQVVRTYAEQETLGPLKGAGRWLAMGVIGALLLGLGLVILLLGLLRLIQTQWTTVATGGWSWVPYMIVLVACLLLLILIVSRINRDSLK